MSCAAPLSKVGADDAESTTVTFRYASLSKSSVSCPAALSRVGADDAQGTTVTFSYASLSKSSVSCSAALSRVGADDAQGTTVTLPTGQLHCTCVPSGHCNVFASACCTVSFIHLGPYAPQGSTSLLPKLSVTSKVSARTSCAWVGRRARFWSSEDVILLEFTLLVERE